MEYDFDVMLHRNIRQGNEFDKLIPSYSNTSINFEKSSKEILESDTFDTLKFINQWVNKYHVQMSKIAPLLKGKTTAETTENIYSWLYNHIQYKLDTSPLKQRLFSPAAAWHYRASGIDCKSFSLLASCILTELKLPHSLRMVKQKGVRSLTDPTKWIVNPNYWSHVYVVVPDGNKTLIIDATTHDNREVQTVEKYDYKMIHQGLNGAYAQRNGLGCACQGTSIQKSGLGNPSTLGFAVANFHKYLNELERQGVSREVTDKMLSLVKYNVDRGIDPNMDEILAKATSGGQLGSAVGNLITEGVGSVKNSAVSAISNISVGGVKVTDVAAAALGDPTALLGIAKGVLSKIIPISFLSNTFGAVFSNGFNFSCWNSTYTPDGVKKDIAKNIQPHFEAKMSAIRNATTVEQLETSLNAFLKDVYVATAVFDAQKNKTNWESCTVKAIKYYRDFITENRKAAFAIVQELQAKGWSYQGIPETVGSINMGGHLYDYTKQVKPYDIIQVSKPKTQVSNPSSGVKNTGGIKNTGGVKNTIVGTKNPANNQLPPKNIKGANILAWGSGLVLAAKLLL